MERSPGHLALNPAQRQSPPLRWRVIGQYLPLAALALAAFLIVRNVTGDDGTTSSLATVGANHSEVLAANIAFFEDRVIETKDSLSYNKLTNFYLQRVREAGDVSDVRRAELSATKSLEAAPGDYAGLVNMALVRIAQHDFAAAATLATSAHEVIPSRPDALAILGDAQMALGKYDEATDNYRIYLEKAPGFAAFSRQATLAEIRGNFPLAEQFWRAAVDAERTDAPENSAWARVQLGNLLTTANRLSEAKVEFETALRVYPAYNFAQAGLAQVAAAEGDDARATELYTKATARVPLPQFIIALGDVYQRAGKSADAQRQFALVGAFDQLFEANGIRNDLTLIAFALDHGGDLNLALERARLAYAERPSLAATDLYAWALYRAGRLDDAAKKSAEALRLGTKDPTFLFHSGMIELARGNSATARLLLQQAFDLNPKFSVQHAAELKTALQSLKGTK
ncbi:MAG: tetratricopeptide repeat protein [Anaerolineaceae bacterium]